MTAVAMRQDGPITRLILLNGAPGVGKSTLAQRYLDDHPLTLLLEIDAIRVSFGCWQDRDESKLLARNLALSLAQAHLRAGYDVIVPQYLGRTEFILALEDVAQHASAEFVELLVEDTEAAIILRFRGRRSEFADQERPHPQADLDGAAVPSVIAEACVQLRTIKAKRVRTQVIMVTEGIESGYLALRRAVGDSGP